MTDVLQALEGPDSLKGERRESIHQEGIQPLAKSTKYYHSGFVVGKDVEGQVCEVEDCQAEKSLSDRQCSHEGLRESVLLQETKALEIRRPAVDPRGLWLNWQLPGHGESYSDCGSWRLKGCLNVEAHTQDGLFEEMAGKVFVRIFKRSCLRAECPICYEKWAGKEAGKIEWRLAAWSKGKVIHVVVSAAKRDYALPYRKLRVKAYSVAKSSGFLGGSCIYHPFRQYEISKRWYFSPHFHLLGYGWIKGTKQGYEKHGWIVKNVGVRKTVIGTAQYQLSHAGVHEKHHTITWFGRLSYNQLKVPHKEIEEETCPICGEKLRLLWYFGSEKLPREEGDFWLSPEGFQIKSNYGDYG